jgi:hypothetical protein
VARGWGCKEEEGGPRDEEGWEWAMHGVTCIKVPENLSHVCLTLFL